VTSLLKVLEARPCTYAELKQLAEAGELELERRAGESTASAVMGELERLGRSVERVARSGEVAVWAIRGARVDGRKPADAPPPHALRGHAQPQGHPWRSEKPQAQQPDDVKSDPVEVITMARPKKKTTPAPSAPPVDGEWVDSSEAARLLGCSRRYAIKLAAIGALTSKRRGEGARAEVLFSRAGIAARIEGQAQPAKTVPAIAAKVARRAQLQEHAGSLVERCRFIVRGVRVGEFTLEEALARLGAAVGEVLS
jgi:hypothetical protein